MYSALLRNLTTLGVLDERYQWRVQAVLPPTAEAESICEGGSPARSSLARHNGSVVARRGSSVQQRSRPAHLLWQNFEARVRISLGWVPSAPAHINDEESMTEWSERNGS